MSLAIRIGVAIGCILLTSPQQANGYNFTPFESIRTSGDTETPIAWPLVWASDNFGRDPVRVVPVTINGSGWTPELIGKLQAAAAKWNEHMFLFQLEVVTEENLTVDLSDDAEVLALVARKAKGGRSENADRISVFYATQEVDDAYCRVFTDCSLSAAGIGGVRGPTPSESPKGLPSSDFGFILFYGERGELASDLELSEHVLTHELGHTLGLDHTTISTAVMYYTGSGGTPFSQDDIAGAIAAGGGASGTSLAFTLLDAAMECPDVEPDPRFLPGCWPKINRALIEVYAANDLDSDPLVSGITGWTSRPTPGRFQATDGAIELGYADFPHMPPGKDLLIRFRPIDESMISDLGLAEMTRFSYPEFGEEWWYNSPKDPDAKVLRLEAGVATGVGDAVGLDGDRDGVANLQEVQQFLTDPSNPDSDGDGKLDGSEISRGTPPLNARPVASISAPSEVECMGDLGASVTLDATSSHDRESDPLSYYWRGPFEEGGGELEGPVVSVTLPLGESQVFLEVRDPYDVSATAVTSIAVVDRSPPNLEVALSPRELWPPNLRLSPIHAELKAVDTCDPDPTTILVSITSNEPDEGIGDGDQPVDFQEAALGNPDEDFLLRSERSGAGDGRVYTVCYEARDKAGNARRVCKEVIVPHDRSGRAGIVRSKEQDDLVVFGSIGMRAASISRETLAVGTSEGYRMPIRADSTGAEDVDHDGIADLVVSLGALSLDDQIRVRNAPSLYARWNVGGAGYLGAISLETVTAAESETDATAGPLKVLGVSPPGMTDAEIRYLIPGAGRVRLSVYDVSGRLVARPVDAMESAGVQVARVRTVRGGTIGSGVYLYRLEWRDEVVRGKLVVVR